jgi:hypoxanthine phosphoribosyltransferase
MPPRNVRPTPRHRRRPRALPVASEEALSPQSEVPRGGLGTDRSQPEAGVQELSWAAFDAHVQALARRIARRFAPQAVVGVAHGGVFVGGALASALGADFFPVRISRRSRVPKRKGSRPRLFGTMPRELKGRDVLIVDDVSASGETLKLAKKLALKAGARALYTATLVSRTLGYAADFTALQSDALFVFPWDYLDVTEDARFGIGPAAPARGRR